MRSGQSTLDAWLRPFRRTTFQVLLRTQESAAALCRVTLIITDLESLEVYIRGFRFTVDGIAGELTDRIATKELRTDFECAAVVEELVLVFVDDGGITRRHGVEGAVGKKLEDDFRTLLASTFRGEISLPLALDIPGAKAG